MACFGVQYEIYLMSRSQVVMYLVTSEFLSFIFVIWCLFLFDRWSHFSQFTHLSTWLSIVLYSQMRCDHKYVNHTICLRINRMKCIMRHQGRHFSFSCLFYLILYVFVFFSKTNFQSCRIVLLPFFDVHWISTHRIVNWRTTHSFLLTLCTISFPYLMLFLERPVNLT